MFKALMTILGLAAGGAPATPLVPLPWPGGSAGYILYEPLFCDRPADFQPRPGADAATWQALLYGEAPDPAKVAALANDASAESRVRALAFNWLRAHGHEVPKRVVVGVIIEYPVDKGLDVLAAYADGRVRYINQSGKTALVEPGGLPVASQMAQALVAHAQPLVDRIGPWDKARLPPPVKPAMRLTFLVSDGLYFGQGPAQALRADPAAGPLILEGARLMQVVIDQALAHPASGKAQP